MALKQTWKFRYTLSEVAQAAQQCLQYHEGKLAIWREREQECEVEVKGSITLDDGYANVQGRTTMVAQPKYDNAKLNALYEAQSHRKEHEGHIEQYTSWYTVLHTRLSESTNGSYVDLDFDDILFFGLANQSETV